ncbi:SLAM family member 5-like [Centropristis striata]|uniref:SLAM family member 5-like n=1 Tax=Centropristis striata TaxID=184440 RepID=UPI0027E1D054|nr:SLAM family member 5-like [Centropristis striata]
MAGGCLSCFFTYISVLLVGVCLHDVEASSCQHAIIHKKVGDTVEFSACLPAEGVATASWSYKGSKIVDRDGVLSGDRQFQGRLDLNPTNLSLTVRRLTLQDSGDFTFNSEDENDKQRDAVTITLHVHEPITKEPFINSSSTWNPLNESCTALLDCSATSDNNVTYAWTVKNQKINGSRLQYTIYPEDTEFTCTVSNVVSKKSASVTVKCSNVTSDKQNKELIFILSAAGGASLLIVVVVGVSVWFCCRKESPDGIDPNELTVYADISEVGLDGTSATMKPCTLYETIDNRGNAIPPGPQTVYDQIQFNRLRKESVSPYQEIS